MKKIIVMALMVMGICSFADERPPEIVSLEAGIAREKDRDKAAVLMQKYEKTFNEYLNSIANNEGAVFYLGDQYFVSRKYERAAKIFGKNTDTMRNLFGAATSHRLIGNYKTAVDYYSEAIERDPNFGESYLGRALAYKGIGNYEGAERDLEIYLAKNRSEAAYLALGDAYMAQKRYDKAVEILQEGRKVYPGSQLLKSMLEQAYSL